MQRKIIIIGGVAGGASAAARLRRLSEEDHIIMFERGEYISFANCGLPYYIGGSIEDRSKLIVQTVTKMRKRFDLDVRNFSEVIKIDRDAKEVVVQNKQTQETYRESYDVLILSPGASPIIPPFAGLEEAKETVFTLRNIPDTDRIFDHISNHNIQNAVVVGGGFIGVEMAENLRERGIDVTLIDIANQVMAPLDYEMAQILHKELNDHGVKLILNDGVSRFEQNGSIVVTSSGKEIKSELTILAIGVTPETKLATEAGLELGTTRGIKVNEKLQTSDSSIYAVGDAIELTHSLLGKPIRIPLANPANRQGRVVADMINGSNITYDGAMGTSVIKVFDKVAASTGLNEKQLKDANIPYHSIHISRGNHAGYYPGASDIWMKLLFQNDGSILGAQAVGESGVEKRIDVISTAIKGKLTIHDLSELELSYAPPFSSAKDPVNILGYVAENVIAEKFQTIHVNEIDDVVSKGGYLLDVRTSYEFKQGHIQGAVNINIDKLRDNLDQLPNDKENPIYINCAVGHRGYLASQILKHNGYKKVYNLSGGYELYDSYYYET